MPRLINPRLIQSHLQDTNIPAAHVEILQAWQNSILTRAIFSQKETALHSHFVQKILIEVLGYQGFGGDSWTLAQEQKIGAGSVDVALGKFSPTSAKILAPFELKGAKTKDLDAIMPGRHKSPVQQAWEYAMDAPGAAWVLVSNYLEIRLYAVGHGRQAFESWDLAKLTDPREYARLQWLLSAKQLLSGETAKILARSEQLEKEITNQLYRDYKALREILLHTLTADNPAIPPLALLHHVQTILDRVLFIAFAEDRGLLPDKTIAHAYQHSDPYNPRPVWENFKGLFRAIDKGNVALNIPAYNGGLFQADPVLESLVVSDELCEAFKNLADYDFASEVSVTVLGHIFEQSISDIEDLQAEARGEESGAVSKRKQHGVVYTPDHITRFIVDFTLGGHLRAKFAELWDASANKRKKDGTWIKKGDPEVQFWRDYQQVLRTTRIVDPACGSGAFLVAAFDYLHDEYTRVNNILADLSGGSYDVFDLDKEILNRNLYGVDLNAESIEITKLSLWLKTAKRGKVLNSLDENIQCGNSLINDPAYTDKPFDWGQFAAAAQAKNQDLFATPADNNGFDVVLGNPPYVRQELISPVKPYLEQHYQVYNGVVDLYAYFFELGLNILKPGGRLGFISSSTFFKTSSGQNLRAYLTQHSSLDCIVDFKDLQIFEGVTTYPAILILTKGKADKDHILRFQELEQLPEQGLLQDFLHHVCSMPQALLTQEGWKLRNGDATLLWLKLTRGYQTLGQICGSPYRGVLTGCNHIFVIDQATRQTLLNQDARANEVIKPFLEGKDLKSWRVEARYLYLIFTRRGIKISDYPAILEYLSAFQAQLESKPANWPARKPWQGRKAGAYQWYEIQDTIAYHASFHAPKIMYPHFQAKPQFYFDTHGYLSNDKTYILPNTGFYELGLLQSKLYWWLITAMCPYVRGQYYELRVQYMETLPIPNASESQKQSIAKIAENCQTIAEQRYQKQEAVRRRIPDLCPPEREATLNTKLKNWWQLSFAEFRAEIKKIFKQDIPLAERNDWEQWLNSEGAEIEKLSAQLTKLEKELNDKVYALFGLTATEIKLVEEN
jgi:type I restriction-modification system DNA methylase subunit